jgi:cytochrome c-type biogenesis protein CcmH/NrfG
MKKLWRAALIVAALSVLATGAFKLGTISTPSQAQQAVPLNAPNTIGCIPTRIQVPTANGLQWNKELMCPDN